MITTIEDTKLEVLSGRIVKGINFCNDTFQQIRTSEDPEQVKGLLKLLDTGAARLHHLIDVAQLYGLDGCVFNSCKYSFDEDGFTCFGCPKTNNREVGDDSSRI